MTTKTLLIKETPQYQGTTSNIVKDIFKVIKQNITEEEQKTYYLPEELDVDKMFYDAAYGTGVNVELTIKRDTDMVEPFLVDAMYVPEEEILEITIQLNPFEEPKSYAPLYQYLMEYVRHELEHFDQEYKGTLPDAEEGLGTMEYYSQPHEIEAQGAGLNLKAKKTRQGYEKVVGDSIELTKQRYGLSDEEGNDLYNLIVGDIEERYGKKELNEHLESREDKERLVTAMNKYFNSQYVPPVEGICEIKVRVSDITTKTEPIRITIVFDKDAWFTKGLEGSITGRIHHSRRSKVDTIRKSVTDEAKRLFGVELWDIGTAFADCDDLSVLYEHYEIPEPESHDAILQYLLNNTKIDYDNRQVKFPFAPLLDEHNMNHTFGFRHLSNAPSPLFYLRPSKSFMEYVKIGGLDEQESINLWLEYRNILREKFNDEEEFPGTFLTEQAESFTPRGHTIFDDEEYKVWAALDKKSFCEFAKGTKWCGEGPVYNRADMWERMYGTQGGGTYYFIKDKKNGDLNLVSDYSKIPLLREGDIRQVFNEDGIPTDRHKFFSHKDQLRKLFDIKYTLQQRIKYEMPFTAEEQQEWYEENTTPLSTVVYALAQGKDVEKNMLLLEDFIGEELGITDRHHYRPASSSVRDYIVIEKEGIVLYMEEETYMRHILCLGEDDDFYYNRAFDHYSDDYEEMDSDELNYMACWFGGDVMKRVYELRERLGGAEKTDCGDFDDGEFNEFFDQHFSKMWDSTTDDLLSHVGYGVGEGRRVQMREYLDTEIIIPATSEGRGEVSIFIPYIQLLFHITNHNMETLSPLLSDNSCIGEIAAGLSDIWYDSWDWPDHTHEEIDYTMNEFLDKLDESDMSVEDRKAGMIKYKKTIKDLNFRPINAWGTQYEFKQPWEGGNTIKVRHYNVEDDTVDLYINTPTMSYRNIPANNIPLEDLVKFTQPTLFKDVWEEIGKGYN